MAEQPEKHDEKEQGSKKVNVGRQLQKKRRELKLSIKHVSTQIRIRPEVLKTLEANQFSEMNEPVYVRGFLRTYASFLGLNGQELVKVLEAQAQLPKEKEMNLPSPVDEGTLPSQGLLLISLAVLILIAVVWQGISWLTPEASDPMPDAPRTPPKEQVEAFQPAQPVPAVQTPAPAFQTPEAVEEQPEQKESDQALPAPDKPEDARIRLYAEEDVWVRIKDPQAGTPIIAEVLEGGRSYWVPPQEGLLMDVGLPPALIVYIDEERMGKSGMIDRRVWELPLIPDYLKSTYFGEGVHLKPTLETPSPANTRPEPQSDAGDVEAVVIEDSEVKVQPAEEEIR
mgnify:CR=1 FL=1